MRALVTGAGGRLGAAMAIRLAELGHDVAVHYSTSRDGAEQTAEAIRGLGRRAETLQADLLDHELTSTLVSRAAEALGGPLTVLVNNASLFEYDSVASATADSWERNVGSNLRAPVFLTQAFAAQAPEAEIDGRGEKRARALVVNMLDQRIEKLTPHYMSYTLGKMGLWAFTQTAARALAPHVRVNGIAPGTTLIGAKQSQEEFEAQRAATVLGRGSNPEDITGALAYLFATPAVTGQALIVDGGQHLGWQTPDILAP